MWKNIRPLLLFSLFCYGFFTLKHVCAKVTHNFSISRIQFPHSSSQTDIVDPTLFSALNQPYHYLSRGHQAFVFLSQDKKYVLKFFRYSNPLPPAVLTHIPLLNQIREFSPKYHEKVARKLRRDFEGYQLAFDLLPTECGLVALHFHPTQNSYPTILIEDPLHNPLHLDLNTTPFILQKVATPAFTQFSFWIEHHEIEKVKSGISQLFALTAKKISLGIEDDDSNLRENLGFIGDVAINIDPGHFKKGEPNPRHSLATALEEWFTKNYPPLVPHVQDCANR